MLRNTQRRLAAHVACPLPIPPLETLHAVEDDKKEQVYQLLGQLNRMEDGDAGLIHESVNLLRRLKMDYLSVSLVMPVIV